MFSQFYIDFADTKKTALMQYCKMENVLPESLVNTHKTRKSIKLHLETAALATASRKAASGILTLLTLTNPFDVIDIDSNMGDSCKKKASYQLVKKDT